MLGCAIGAIGAMGASNDDVQSYFLVALGNGSLWQSYYLYMATEEQIGSRR